MKWVIVKQSMLSHARLLLGWPCQAIAAAVAAARLTTLVQQRQTARKRCEKLFEAFKQPRVWLADSLHVLRRQRTAGLDNCLAHLS
jgi:6-phosphogluconate dehydrogenase